MGIGFRAAANQCPAYINLTVPLATSRVEGRPCSSRCSRNHFANQPDPAAIMDISYPYQRRLQPTSNNPGNRLAMVDPSTDLIRPQPARLYNGGLARRIALTKTQWKSKEPRLPVKLESSVEQAFGFSLSSGPGYRSTKSVEI